jgi:tRNA 2-thiouridine synthesizing protein A
VPYDLHPGDTLEVTCSDPGALNDIPAWCRINGHIIVDKKERDDLVIITVEVGNT